MKKIALLAVTPLLCLGSFTAEASIVCNVSESGTDVVFSASGSINLSGLSRWGFGPGDHGIQASRPWCAFGTASDLYEVTSAPAPNHFGPGTGNSVIAPDTWTNSESFGVAFNPAVSTKTFILVPRGYAGTTLSNSMTFFNSSLNSLGLKTGTYTWSLANGQYFQLRIGGFGSGPVPEPTTALIWSMLAGLGLVARRRRT
ncbi:MAG: PEP-CTERM sorting domain-containing protein [Mariniblastus sp.]|nr:PEP-CTERM sorting domain-containing protein [Mariniblastus sp.]